MPWVPSEEEISELPGLARVAFAARCARRVEPLFKSWADANGIDSLPVANVIVLAEKYATAGEIHAADAAARAAAYAADAAGCAGR